MAEQTRAEPTSVGVASERIDSPALQSQESRKEGLPRELAGQGAQEVTAERTRRRGREAALRVRVKPRGAPIDGIPRQIAKRSEERSGGPTPEPTSGTIAREPVESAKRVAGNSPGICNRLAGPREAMPEPRAKRQRATAPEIISAAALHSPDAIALGPSAVPQNTGDETLYAAVGSPEALPEEEMEQSVTSEISSRVPLPEAAAPPSTERAPRWEIERALQLATVPQPTMREVLARWRDALWEKLHGRWIQAGCKFVLGTFHLLTEAATWRCTGKAVLKFLVRCLPLGRGPEPSRLSKAIKECFREFHEDRRKAGSWTNCPK